MTGYLILFVVLIVASAALIFTGVCDRFGWIKLPTSITHHSTALMSCFSGWIDRIRLSIDSLKSQIESLTRVKPRDRISEISDEDSSFSEPADMSVLSCRVGTGQLRENGGNEDAFDVEICGSIQAPKEGCQAYITISLVDVTQESSTPVQTFMDHKTSSNGPKMAAFCRRVGLGRLPQQVTVLPDWTTVAQIRIGNLLFARKGQRNLLLKASISSAENNEELASGVYIYHIKSDGDEKTGKMMIIR